MTFPTDWMPCPDIHVFTSRDKARKFAVNKYGSEPELIHGNPGVTTSMKDDHGNMVCLVVIEADVMNVSQKVSLLAHECVHVAQAWAACMGESRPGEEWMAYAVQSSMLVCLTQLGYKWLEESEPDA